MRIKDVLVEYLTDQDKQKYLDMAINIDSAIFARLAVSDTGLSKTILVSQDEIAPVIIIVDGDWADSHSIVVPLKGKSPYKDINKWLKINRKNLEKLLVTGDTFEFLDNMNRINLTEMVNLLPKDTGLNNAVYCDTRDVDSTGHAIRIKVSLTNNTISKSKSTVIMLEPEIVVAPNCPKLDSKDFDLVRTWIQLNLESIKLYIQKEIDTTSFKNKLVDINGVNIHSKNIRKKNIQP